MDQLSDRSERIKDVVRLIEDVAGQTRMLAFNASIEAAHAGEAGKGFAVVADEVRKLSDRAGDAVEEITATLGGMLQDIGRTAEGLELIRTDVAGTSDLLDRTSLHFGRLLADFESHASQLTDTTGRVQTVAATSQTIHSQAQVILDVSRQAADRLGSSLQFCLDMNRATEQLLEQVSRFRTGQSELEQVIDRVARWRDTLQDRIGALAAAGVDVFDRDYRAIPHTQPQKHLTAYAERFARELQPLFDEARRDLGAIYAVALDVNGYLAIHHSGVSEPLTGDPQVDLVKSRHQRIYFTVDTEKRRAQNTETFLFQTYMRDTGELLNDLSMPIYIQGRHWGALVTGFTPDRFLGA